MDGFWAIRAFFASLREIAPPSSSLPLEQRERKLPVHKFVTLHLKIINIFFQIEDMIFVLHYIYRKLISSNIFHNMPGGGMICSPLGRQLK